MVRLVARDRLASGARAMSVEVDIASLVVNRRRAARDQPKEK
jgi:hypothetical protein